MLALPWRSPASLSYSTGELIREALFAGDAWQAMDSLLGISAQPSEIDAYWLSNLLDFLPIGTRDGFWSAYLHNGYEKNGIVARIIEATTDIDLEYLDCKVAARWALILLWFTAAADRRVKDHATRGVTAIFRAKCEIIAPSIARIQRFYN